MGLCVHALRLGGIIARGCQGSRFLRHGNILRELQVLSSEIKRDGRTVLTWD